MISLVDRYNRFTPIRREYERLLKMFAVTGNIIQYNLVKGLLQTASLMEDIEYELKTKEFNLN